MPFMWRMPLAASPHGLGTLPTTTMRRPGRAIACSVLIYVTGIRSLRFLVKAPAHHPGLVDRAIVADHHDAEQQVRRLLDGLRASRGDQRLAPGQRLLAGGPVERHEVGLLAGLEVADQVVDVERLGAAERDRPEAAPRRDLVALGL